MKMTMSSEEQHPSLNYQFIWRRNKKNKNKIRYNKNTPSNKSEKRIRDKDKKKMRDVPSIDRDKKKYVPFTKIRKNTLLKMR